MEAIVGAVITKVYEGKAGEGQYGPWQIYNFYVKDRTEKFSVFGTEKLTPVPGMTLKLLKYEISKSEKDGKIYTNFNVKEMIPDDEKGITDSPGKTIIPAQKKDTDWDAIARGKCKFGFLQQAFVPYLKGELFKVEDEGSLQLLEENAELFVDMCMRTGSTTATQTAKKEKDDIDPVCGIPYADTPPPADDDIPF